MRKLRSYTIASNEEKVPELDGVSEMRINGRYAITNVYDVREFSFNRQGAAQGYGVWGIFVTFSIGNLNSDEYRIYYECRRNLPEFRIKHGNFWFYHRPEKDLILSIIKD